ncbi:hypothetical protein Agabi119p4_9955 [Agaricus bisporus var. burnettii]|uniref:Uncharacterized protein n=1 Tax=Agaricus bisporus var. burnettii TaxID=192524 RepID=A0A8H7EX53_AGABI|nr:hypothetical protein Agabi119p4_9955 [Agaricus bisporus var. burnettii]
MKFYVLHLTEASGCLTVTEVAQEYTGRTCLSIYNQTRPAFEGVDRQSLPGDTNFERPSVLIYERARVAGFSHFLSHG